MTDPSSVKLRKIRKRLCVPGGRPSPTRSSWSPALGLLVRVSQWETSADYRGGVTAWRIYPTSSPSSALSLGAKLPLPQWLKFLTAPALSKWSLFHSCDSHWFGDTSPSPSGLEEGVVSGCVTIHVASTHLSSTL